MGWLERRRRERDDELLSAYIDGQLLGRARSEFEARLAGEPELRTRLEATRRMLGMVRSLPTVPAPRNFILDPARYGARARPRPAARLYPTLRLATALATLVLLVVFAGDLITQVALPFGAAAPAPPQPANESDRGTRTLAAATAAPPGQPVPQAVPQTAVSPAVQPTQPPAPPTQALETQAQPTAVAKAAGPQVKASPSPPAAGRPSSQPPAAGGGQTDMSATPNPAAPSLAAVPATPLPTPATPTVAPSPVPPTPTALPSPVPPTGVAVSQAPAGPQEQPPATAYQGERSVRPNPWRIAEAGLVALVIVLAAATILARRLA